MTQIDSICSEVAVKASGQEIVVLVMNHPGHVVTPEEEASIRTHYPNRLIRFEYGFASNPKEWIGACLRYRKDNTLVMMVQATDFPLCVFASSVGYRHGRMMKDHAFITISVDMQKPDFRSIVPSGDGRPTVLFMVEKNREGALKDALRDTLRLAGVERSPLFYVQGSDRKPQSWVEMCEKVKPHVVITDIADARTAALATQRFRHLVLFEGVFWEIKVSFTPLGQC